MVVILCFFATPCTNKCQTPRNAVLIKRDHLFQRVPPSVK